MSLRTQPPAELHTAVPLTGTETLSVDAAAGRELEQARSADAAWRTERSLRFQRRLDRTRKVATLGRRWFLSAGDRLGVLFRYFFGLNLVVRILGDVVGWPWLEPLAKKLWYILLAWAVLGLCVYGLGGLAHRWTLRSAQRDYVAVVDEGTIPLRDAELPPAAKPTPS